MQTFSVLSKGYTYNSNKWNQWRDQKCWLPHLVDYITLNLKKKKKKRKKKKKKKKAAFRNAWLFQNEN